MIARSICAQAVAAERDRVIAVLGCADSGFAAKTLFVEAAK